MTTTEINARKVELEKAMAEALKAVKKLTPATLEFDATYGEYLSAKASLAKIPDEIAKAKLAENADAIKGAATAVAEAIGQLVAGLKVAELVGEPIVNLRYIVAEDGAKVIFNPKITLRTKGPAEAKNGAAKAGRTVIIQPDGTELSVTKFVLAHATEAEKASKEYKYPHTQADTKPKFDAFCASHGLAGFEYKVPEVTETAAA